MNDQGSIFAAFTSPIPSLGISLVSRYLVLALVISACYVFQVAGSGHGVYGAGRVWCPPRAHWKMGFDDVSDVQ